MPGPLPKPGARRRNKPTIPSTSLPAAGYSGPIPRIPKGLGAAGRVWWRWAWRTPQAKGWDGGSVWVVGRRASLEDDMAALGLVESDLDLAELLDMGMTESLKQLELVIRRLHALAGGRLAVMREMRELDDRLGLTPKGRLALRWEIQPDEVEEAREAKASSSRARLSAVDPAASLVASSGSDGRR